MAQDSNLPTTLAVTSGFRPGTLPTRSAILERSMEDSNLRTGRPVYALAGRCRSRWANAPGCPTPDSNREPLPSEGSASASWARRAMRADDQVRTGDLGVGNAVLYLLSYVRIEPAGGIEPPTFPLPKGCSAY